MTPMVEEAYQRGLVILADLQTQWRTNKQAVKAELREQERAEREVAKTKRRRYHSSPIARDNCTRWHELIPPEPLEEGTEDIYTEVATKSFESYRRKLRYKLDQSFSRRKGRQAMKKWREKNPEKQRVAAEKVKVYQRKLRVSPDTGDEVRRKDRERKRKQRERHK